MVHPSFPLAQANHDRGILLFRNICPIVWLHAEDLPTAEELMLQQLHNGLNS